MVNQLPYPPAKILWPLVGAMNLLWSRLQRAQQIEREHQHLQQVIVSYTQLIQQEGSHASLPLVQTGTVLDPLILAAQASHSRELRQNISRFESQSQSDFPSGNAF